MSTLCSSTEPLTAGVEMPSPSLVLSGDYMQLLLPKPATKLRSVYDVCMYSAALDWSIQLHENACYLPFLQERAQLLTNTALQSTDCTCTR